MSDVRDWAGVEDDPCTDSEDLCPDCERVLEWLVELAVDYFEGL